MNLIPQVKVLELKEGYLSSCFVNNNTDSVPEKLKKVYSLIPQDESGITISFNIGNGDDESYEIKITTNEIEISANSEKGGFYALQTLRQIFKEDKIPCLYIKDYPDFKYRGFYHDATRGKIASVETIKRLIDTMAYLKLNSLQLYVEHTYEFKETKNLAKDKGAYTQSDLREIDAYCKENFIEFIPSLATFGHLFELLEQKEYNHLRAIENYTAEPNFWNDRMAHHTVNPLKSESFQLIKSLLDQYCESFSSDIFNICCDETFDLSVLCGEKTGEVYADFVKKIIAHLKSKGKKVMMWADILLQHPEFIEQIPEDTYFLNWGYDANPDEDNIRKFAALNRHQIVCPGTSSWSRFCENVKIGTSNISLMAEYGKKYNADGVLNTNWGDWGNPASIENATYGLTVGAEKSWSADTVINSIFDENINKLIYNCFQGAECIKVLSTFHENFHWNDFIKYYYNIKCGNNPDNFLSKEKVKEIQEEYKEVSALIKNADWKTDEFKEEFLICADAVCLIAELVGKYCGYEIEKLVDIDSFIKQYSALWEKKNKPCELYEIIKVFKEMNDF